MGKGIKFQINGRATCLNVKWGGPQNRSYVCGIHTGSSMAREEFPAFRTCRQRGTNILPVTTSRSAIPLSRPPSNDKTLRYNFPMRIKIRLLQLFHVSGACLGLKKLIINLLGILYTYIYYKYTYMTKTWRLYLYLS